MFSALAKWLLTSTAIAPVALTYAWVAFQASKYELAAGLLVLCALLVFISLCLLRFARQNIERVNFKAQTIEAADNENIAFLLLYLLPLFTANIETLTWQVWLPMIVIFAIITATSYSYHFNPLLGMMGWHFYKVTTAEGVTYVLITKKQLRNAAEQLQVGQLTEYILLDQGDKK
ncbi:MAG: hypothetical protein C0519_01540 [Hyphomicrobium sp.]|nr:hypothetical protein [Hyphomicrobium sp.]PPD09523.1 MAG: hypothetical protein CTY28_01565 [Hyphomicrobium sp.]